MSRVKTVSCNTVVSVFLVMGCVGCGLQEDEDPLFSVTGPVGTLLYWQWTLDSRGEPDEKIGLKVMDTRTGTVGPDLFPIDGDTVLLTLSDDGRRLLQFENVSADGEYRFRAYDILPEGQVELAATAAFPVTTSMYVYEDDVFVSPDSTRALARISDETWRVIEIDDERVTSLSPSGSEYVPRTDMAVWSPDNEHFILYGADSVSMVGVYHATLYHMGKPLWSVRHGVDGMSHAFSPNGEWVALTGDLMSVGEVGTFPVEYTIPVAGLHLYHIPTRSFHVAEHVLLQPALQNDPFPWTSDSRHLWTTTVYDEPGMLNVEQTALQGTVVHDEIPLDAGAEGLQGEVIATLPGNEGLLTLTRKICTTVDSMGWTAEYWCELHFHQFTYDGAGSEEKVFMETCYQIPRGCTGLIDTSFLHPEVCMSGIGNEFTYGPAVLELDEGTWRGFGSRLEMASIDCASIIEPDHGELHLLPAGGDVVFKKVETRDSDRHTFDDGSYNLVAPEELYQFN